MAWCGGGSVNDEWVRLFCHNCHEEWFSRESDLVEEIENNGWINCSGCGQSDDVERSWV